MHKKALLITGCLGAGLTGLAMAGGNRAAVVIENVLLQATTPGTAQIGHANITGTFRASQVLANSASATTTPVIGNNNSTGANAIGGSFSTFSQTGIGLRSTATNTGGSAKAIYAEARAPGGIGLDSEATANGGRAIYAKAPGSFSTGVYTEALGNGGYGLSSQGGWVGIGTAGVNFGAIAAVHPHSSDSTIHAGVYGEGLNDSSGNCMGVYAEADNAGAGTCYGVAGIATGSGTNWGLYAFGNSGATGTKSFEIDHPLSPETETLRHYSAEGPEPLLVYQGNAQLDSRGSVTVRLPDYVAAIGRDFRYQLTPVGAPMPNLFVSRTFADGTFGISGGAPGKTVSWTLTGVRNDRWVREHGAPVEVPKPAAMQGKYLEPELYGRPESDGVRVKAPEPKG